MKLRPNQIAAVDAVEDAFRAGINRPLVDSCVGSGKSLGMAELARRTVARGERVLWGAHTRELVEQNAAAGRALGLQVGINAEALGERTWRAPVICASIQSVFSSAHSFGPIGLLIVDECDLVPHGEQGMYRTLHRGLGLPRMSGWSGTTFRLQGGSLVEGEDAPFEKVVYSYSIIDGIRDGYLVPAFSAQADDKIDVRKLRVSKGEYTGASQDAQMLQMMDNHIMQMMNHGRSRRSWLVFEASSKATLAMCERMNQWGIRTAAVLSSTPPGERAAAIADYRAGRIRALTNINTLSVGFDVQETDMIVMRRATKSLRLYVQQIGRGLRTIGGTIEKSIAAGKNDALVIDFANNISTHGPLDFIRPKPTAVSLVSCDHCGKRNQGAAARCWNCDEPMTKLCPACLGAVEKGVMDCPHCAHDMRAGERGDAKAAKLLDTPSGAALISSFAKVVDREGWTAIRKAYRHASGAVSVDTAETRIELPEPLWPFGEKAKWIAQSGALLIPNGQSRTSAVQVDVTGMSLVVPMPPALETRPQSGREAPRAAAALPA